MNATRSPASAILSAVLLTLLVGCVERPQPLEPLQGAPTALTAARMPIVEPSEPGDSVEVYYPMPSVEPGEPLPGVRGR